MSESTAAMFNLTQWAALAPVGALRRQISRPADG